MPQNDKSLLILTPHPGVEFSEKGMLADKLLTYEQWQSVGEALADIHKKSFMFFMWAWGDWLQYGEARYGEKYSQAMGRTGLAERTLTNYVWLAKATPKDLRGLPDLGQSHYERVVKIKDPEMKRDLLQLASKEKWPAKTKLASAVAALLGSKEDNISTSPRPGTAQDNLDLAQQERYMLEQRNIQLQLEQDLLKDQIGRAQNMLEPVLDQVEPDTQLEIEKTIDVLQSKPNGELLALVKQIVTFYRQGNMTALVDELGKLSLLMEDDA